VHDREVTIPEPDELKLLWLLYARRPEGMPPRRWRGLVGYGRLDIAARFLLASLYPGGRLLSGRGLLLFLDRGGEGKAVLLGPGCLPERLEGEPAAATLLLRVLRGGMCGGLAPAEWGALLRELRRAGWRIVLLREDGSALEPRLLRGAVLVVGSRVDPPERGPYDARIRVGCFPYLASAVAAYINLVLESGLLGDEG